MKGIDLNKPIFFQHASMRFFGENEHHVDRVCKDDVLLLVFDGVLRFSEDGIAYEVNPGQYHIQKHGSCQCGPAASDAPKYLYVHFRSQWTEGDASLPFRGNFDYPQLKALMEKLDTLSHGDHTLTHKCAAFMELLTQLHRSARPAAKADPIARYLAEHLEQSISLEQLSREFHFSKNHIIHLFKDAYGMTPIDYCNDLRLRKAMRLLEATSHSADEIAAACGFQNYSHFYRLFLRANAVSPTKWRNMKRIGL